MLEVGASIGRGAMRIINGMVRGLASLGVPPNILTIIGVAINIFCGVMFAMGNFFGAGIILIVANLFDMLDGNVARMTGRVTRYGGFLDSTLDRLSDMGAFLGIMVFYARLTEHHSTMNVFLGGVGMITSVLVSYTTARSESFYLSSERCRPGTGTRKIGSQIECRRFYGYSRSAQRGRLFSECGTFAEG
jgi:CDP-diacylglycerol--glycerol-3-phosphate 3-phosphatidyltransferase